MWLLAVSLRFTWRFWLQLREIRGKAHSESWKCHFGKCWPVIGEKLEKHRIQSGLQMAGTSERMGRVRGCWQRVQHSSLWKYNLFLPAIHISYQRQYNETNFLVSLVYLNLAWVFAEAHQKNQLCAHSQIGHSSQSSADIQQASLVLQSPPGFFRPWGNVEPQSRLKIHSRPRHQDKASPTMTS